MRSLHKKLRQIEQLKQKKADGEELQENQVAKLKTEPAIREELRREAVHTAARLILHPRKKTKNNPKDYGTPRNLEKRKER